MKKSNKNEFVEKLKKYITIRGIEFEIQLYNGKKFFFKNNLELKNNNLIAKLSKNEIKIPISEIKSINLYAA